MITDGRFSGGSHGFVVGHLSPEAAVGGPLAIVRNGDTITVNISKREICLEVTAAEIKKRLKKWRLPKRPRPVGVLAKYAHQVGSASLGAITDP